MTLIIAEIIRNLNKYGTVFYLFKYYKFYRNLYLVLLQSLFLKILLCICFDNICVHKLGHFNNLITFILFRLVEIQSKQFLINKYLRISLLALRFKEKLRFIVKNRQLFFNFFYILYYPIVDFHTINNISKTLSIEL